MTYDFEKRSEFRQTAIATLIFSIVFTVIGASVAFFLPSRSSNSMLDNKDLFSEIVADSTVAAITDVNNALNVGFAGNESFEKLYLLNPVNFAAVDEGDKGLELYRNVNTRTAVEWFYLRVTGRRDIALAILEEADKQDIPLSLAFALAYTESRYNLNAVNANVNGSIDRGLFQLNNRSFPRLEEEDFFSAKTSARYGMSHLRYCMNVAGNDLTALAMYNAGVTRVKSDKTPKITLAYVSKIVSYRAIIETAFEEEVLSYYGNTNNSNASVIGVVAQVQSLEKNKDSKNSKI